MKTDLTDKTALVIGGTGEIGTAICRQLAHSGARVACDYQDEASAVACRESLARDNIEIHTYAANLTDMDSCSQLVATVEADIGPIDIIINALELDSRMRFREMEKSDWDNTMSVNLDSVFNICRQVVDGMGSRGYGRIVNLSSIVSRKGEERHSHYAAAKAGVHGFTMSLAQELARGGVTVNTVSPGHLETSALKSLPDEERDRMLARVPAARLGRLDEVASLVDFLCSEQAAFITGTDIAVNGGQYMY